MRPADLHTLATRRVFGLESKNRTRRHFYIEDELLQVIQREGIDFNDFANQAIQEYTTQRGIPIIALRVNKDDTVSFINLLQGDILNMALGDLMDRKGYRPDST